MTNDKLDFWIANNLNVLFRGEKGTGKTTRVLEAFERNRLKWLYFSTSTLDVWTDIIGIPREATDKNGVKYLDFIRPKALAEDSVQAIMFDEISRSHKKTRNAIMELIQFKSLNGKKFNNLRLIWAATNPAEEDISGRSYDVEDLDPAQEDRFHVIVDVPYKPDRDFFSSKFGADGLNAVDWWFDLTPEVQKQVSPRRLEYALSMNLIGGDLRDILPKSANVTKLMQELKGGSFKKNLMKVFSTGNSKEAKKFICNINNFDNCIDEIVKNDKMIALFIPHIEDEKLSDLALKNDKVQKFIDAAIAGKNV